MGHWLISAGDSAKTKLGGFWAAMLMAAPGPGGPGSPGAPGCGPGWGFWPCCWPWGAGG